MAVRGRAGASRSLPRLRVRLRPHDPLPRAFHRAGAHHRGRDRPRGGAVPGGDVRRARRRLGRRFRVAPAAGLLRRGHGLPFFSHLPETRFEPWLGRLCSASGATRAPRIFSVHGDAAPRGPDPMPPSGFVFRADERNPAPRRRGVRNLLRHAGVRPCTGRRSWRAQCPARVPLRSGRLPGPLHSAPPSRCPRAWTCGWHGSRGESRIARPSRTEWLTSKAGRPEPPTSGHPTSASSSATRSRAFSPGEGARGSKRRWSFSFPIGAVSPDDVVRIEAETARGLSKVLLAATLRPYLSAAASLIQ